MKTFFRFFISRQFLINFGIIILLWVVIVWGFFAYIKSYGRFEEQIKVPDFTGLHLDDLDEFVENKNITYEIIDSVYLDEVPKGTVIKQTPLPTDSTGVHVKQDRKIKLSVVPLMERMVEVPDMRSKSKAMAEIMLDIIGLRANIEFQPDEAGKDFVIDQKLDGKHLSPGTKLRKGSKITLIVSKGKGGATEVVPNLFGLTVEEAQNKVSNQALSIYVAECKTCVSAGDEKKAQIVKQSPGSTAEISAGSTITVWITTDPVIKDKPNDE